jgi:hypothetical protein
MGTGAVYLSLSNLKNHPDFLTNVEIGFFCLNIFCTSPNVTLFPASILATSAGARFDSLLRPLTRFPLSLPSRTVFLLNSSILLLQLVLFRQQFKRLVTDPVKGVVRFPDIPQPPNQYLFTSTVLPSFSLHPKEDPLT